MFTRNFYNVLHSHIMGVDIPNGLTDPNGTKYTCYDMASKGDHLRVPVNVKYLATSFATAGYVVVGSGSTPPSVDDYCLEAPITSVEHDGITSSVDENNNVIKTLSFRNSSSEAITIREVGVAMSGYKTNTSSGTGVFMAYREVLDTPYVVAAGAVGYITLKFDWPAIPV